MLHFELAQASFEEFTKSTNINNLRTHAENFAEHLVEAFVARPDTYSDQTAADKMVTFLGHLGLSAFGAIKAGDNAAFTQAHGLAMGLLWNINSGLFQSPSIRPSTSEPGVVMVPDRHRMSDYRRFISHLHSSALLFKSLLDIPRNFNAEEFVQLAQTSQASALLVSEELTVPVPVIRRSPLFGDHVEERTLRARAPLLGLYLGHGTLRDQTICGLLENEVGVPGPTPFANKSILAAPKQESVAISCFQNLLDQRHLRRFILEDLSPKPSSEVQLGLPLTLSIQ